MLEEEYEKQEDIPSGWSHLYIESDGKWKLVSSTQIKTQEDVDKLAEGARKEREDHKKTKEKLAKFGSLDPTEVQTQLDRIPDLELAADAAGNDDEAIEKRVSAKLKTHTAPLERQIETLTTERDAAQTSLTEFRASDEQRQIKDHIRDSAMKAKCHEGGIRDALNYSHIFMKRPDDNKIVTKDGIEGVTPGLDAAGWLGDILSTTGHWYPEAKGGNSKGGNGASGGVNPWTHDNWNLTEQGKLLTTDRSRAESMAKSAGTTIGGARPEPKK